MKKVLIISGVFTALIFLAGLTYYFAVQIPQRKIAKLELEKAKIIENENQDREAKLDTCLEDAKTSYKDRWRINCIGKDREFKTIDGVERCSLPSELSSHLDDIYEDLRKECIDRYK